MSPGLAAGVQQVGDALGDEGRLVLDRGQVRDHRRRAQRRPGGAQPLAVGVAGGEAGLGQGDDLGRRAVVGLEGEDPRARDGGEAGHGLRVGPAPGVDRLVGVGDGHQVAAAGGQGLGQAALDGAGVVQLVDQHEADRGDQPPRGRAAVVQQALGQHQQVGVVDRPDVALALGVGPAHVARISSTRSTRRGLDSSTTSSSGRPSSAARPKRPARAEGAGSDGRSRRPAPAPRRAPSAPGRTGPRRPGW